MALPATDAEPAVLRLEGIDRRFGGVHAVRNVDLEVRPGERRAVLAPGPQVVGRGDEQRAVLPVCETPQHVRLVDVCVAVAYQPLKVVVVRGNRFHVSYYTIFHSANKYQKKKQQI
jgi:hypothetical protein